MCVTICRDRTLAVKYNQLQPTNIFSKYKLSKIVNQILYCRYLSDYLFDMILMSAHNIGFGRELTVYLFSTQSRLLTTLNETAFENIFGKGENAGNQHFLLFQRCFLPFPKQVLILYSNLFCLLQML